MTLELLKARNVTLPGKDGWTFEYRLRDSPNREIVVRVKCSARAQSEARRRQDKVLLDAIETRGLQLALSEAQRLRGTHKFTVIEVELQEAGAPLVRCFPPEPRRR
jgi:hypothetical protein